MKYPRIRPGDKFTRLTVVSKSTKLGHWNVICICGKNRVVADWKLKSGHTRSCGCLKAKHGLSHSDIYSIWRGIRSRCNNQKNISYKNYGGRGITVCGRWDKSFINFVSDIPPRPTSRHWIERIDNEGNYEPGNITWELPKKQQLNKRTNRRISFNGKTQTLIEWAYELKIHPHTLSERLCTGWSVKRALSTPTGKYITNRKRTIFDREWMEKFCKRTTRGGKK